MPHEPSEAMHDHEVPHDVELVRDLIRAQFPEWADLGIRYASSQGTSHALYRLGDELVVRLPRVEYAVESIGEEAEWLPRLAPQLPLAIPTPRAVGEPDLGYPWPWSVNEWIDGTTLDSEATREAETLGEDLAGFVAALQSVDSQGAPRATRGQPLEVRDTETREAIAELGGEIDGPALLRAWERSLELPGWDRAPRWFHGDLLPGNLLFREGRLAAVIDFGCSGVGDPACDLIAAWGVLPAGARERFRSRLEIDEATWARGRGWALSVALVIIPYYRKRNPGLVRQAWTMIDEVQRDLRTH